MTKLEKRKMIADMAIAALGAIAMVAVNHYLRRRIKVEGMKNGKRRR